MSEATQPELPDRPAEPTEAAEPERDRAPEPGPEPGPEQPGPEQPEPEPEPVEPAVAEAAAVEPAEPAAGPAGLDKPDGSPAAAPDEPDGDRGRFQPTSVVTLVLLALLGFTLTVQVRNVAEDPTVAALGQEDLVRILANLDAHEERLRQDIAELQESRRRLATAGESRQEALAEAARRADELGVLAGTLPVEGPGVVVTLRGGAEAVTAARLLDAVQELRSAGAEAMQIEGAGAPAVRVIASSYFVDADGGIVVDGESLAAPYRLTVIGEPGTLAPALQIPGGVAESVQRDGGTVTVQEEPGGVEVLAVREQAPLRHARPDS